MHENIEIEKVYSTTEYVIMVILLIPIFIAFCHIALYVIEINYQRIFKKPLFVFTQIYSKQLNDLEKSVLARNNTFYKRLSPKYKKHFEHRVASFIEKTKFSARSIDVNQEMKLIIASVYIQLTFGMKNYLNKLIEQIIIYPEAYLSTHTNEYYKGEFNPLLKTIVFSWEDFKQGIAIENDNLNLGLHEFTHALHFNTKKSDKTAHRLFNDSLNDLLLLLSNENLRMNLLNSGVLREYAFENKYEFLAVLLEHFFESPNQLKQEFPSIYNKVKEMLNYNEKIFTA